MTKPIRFLSLQKTLNLNRYRYLEFKLILITINQHYLLLKVVIRFLQVTFLLFLINQLDLQGYTRTMLEWMLTGFKHIKVIRCTPNN